VRRGYSYGFNGKENDSDINSGAYDFGARIYDGRLARWWSVDALFGKYPYYTPYSAMNNSPIFTIDVDGNEGIVVSSQPGGHKNKENFLVNGLDRCKKAKKYSNKTNEGTTWIIYNDKSKDAGHDPKMLKKYQEKAKKQGITVIVTDNADDIIEYVNEKKGGSTRAADPITSFYYIGHAEISKLSVGYGGDGEYITPKDFKSEAFSGGCHVNLVGGCRTAVPGYWYDSNVENFAEILDVNSTVYGSDVRTNYSKAGVMSDTELLESNKGKIVERKGQLPAK
jgi:RHS repeat-associated protein